MGLEQLLHFLVYLGGREGGERWREGEDGGRKEIEGGQRIHIGGWGVKERWELSVPYLSSE